MPSEVAVQPGIAADRFAREIIAFGRLLPARSRQLNANPLGGQAINVASRSDRLGIAIHAALVGRFSHVARAWDAHIIPRRSADSVMWRVPGVLAVMPRRGADADTRPMPAVLARMPHQSADSRAREHACGVGNHAWGAGVHAWAVG